MKRLIVCSDGTWNKPDSKDRGKIVETNVEKIFKCICPNDDEGATVQKIWYDQGIGTGYSNWQNIIDGMTGRGIDKNIKDAYSFLVFNYEQTSAGNDELFLFGFSRGAYTVRSLAGLIRNCGILKPEYYHLLGTAYELYRDRNKYTAPDSDMMKGFREKYAYETDIHFIGVWDTVGALGIPLPWYKMYNQRRYRFHDQQLSSTVKHGYHALAIDERRELFSPTLWKQSKDIEPGKQKMEQRWFVGVHSNVGGGYENTELSDLALNWLIQKSQDAGLCFHKDKIEGISGNYTGELRDSYSRFYWLVLSFPALRKIDLQCPLTYQSIDKSVYDRKKKGGYNPRNLPG